MPADLDVLSVTEALGKAGCVFAADEARELVQAAAGDQDVLAGFLSRRMQGEPLAWLTGTIMFCGVRLVVAPGVYVPRLQTEALARRATELLPAEGTAVDLCTGAGPIAAVLQAAAPLARIVATDLDTVAVQCARHNGVDALEGSLDDSISPALEHAVDLLTAVVPYVPTGSLRLLPRDVQAFEPTLALDGGPDGTDLLTEVVRRGPRWLRPGGWLLLELGGDQARSIGSLLHEVGFKDLDVMTDGAGDPRGICARLG
jgi:release factor glutamine methyltransferase